VSYTQARCDYIVTLHMAVVCAMEEFYVIGNFTDSRAVESFEPAATNIDACKMAVDILDKHEKDADGEQRRYMAEVEERKTGGKQAQEEAMRRIEADKIERMEREEAKERMRQVEAEREQQAKASKKAKQEQALQAADEVA